MIRLGLCCKFISEPVRFRTTTATRAARLARPEALQLFSELCLSNARALGKALSYCAANGIGDFRVGSDHWPVKTHPEVGYEIDELPQAERILKQLEDCRQFVRARGMRMTLHPDQFVLLSSADDGVTQRSIADLEYHGELAEIIGADVINIHGGGAYGDKPRALARVARNLDRLSERARTRVTMENDDRVYTPRDLLPVCRETGVPLVYDAHHHRCLPDGAGVTETTEAARETWAPAREPVVHVSSPKQGWDQPKPSRHHDYIDPDDFPECWRDNDATVEVEAKAKEKAIARLLRDLRGMDVQLWEGS